MYDSCEIHELQGLKCVKSPMEQKHLHFPLEAGGVLLELGKCVAVRTIYVQGV